MSLRLVLMRHAKSSWAVPGQPDRARPLNARGRASAEALGVWLAARNHLPEEALVSDAARTRETWAHVAAQLPEAPEARFLPELYLAEAEAMLDALHDASARSVLLLGHNPSIASLASMLVHTPPEDARFSRYPTGATTVLDFAHEEWIDIRPRQGRLVDFVVPRDLI